MTLTTASHAPYSWRSRIIHTLVLEMLIYFLFFLFACSVYALLMFWPTERLFFGIVCFLLMIVLLSRFCCCCYRPAGFSELGTRRSTTPKACTDPEALLSRVPWFPIFKSLPDIPKPRDSFFFYYVAYCSIDGLVLPRSLHLFAARFRLYALARLDAYSTRLCFDSAYVMCLVFLFRLILVCPCAEMISFHQRVDVFFGATLSFGYRSGALVDPKLKRVACEVNATGLNVVYTPLDLIRRYCSSTLTKCFSFVRHWLVIVDDCTVS